MLESYVNQLKTLVGNSKMSVVTLLVALLEGTEE